MSRSAVGVVYRVMFWTDWGMDIIDTDIVWPNSIAVDCDTNTIYWLEAYHDRIESADLNGRSRRVVFRNGPARSLVHGFYLLVNGDHMYWSDWFFNKIYKAPLPSTDNEPPQNLTDMSHTAGRLFGFTVVDTASPRNGGKARGGVRGVVVELENLI